MSDRQDELRKLAAETVLAAMSSVGRGKISPERWWDRAGSALRAAANAAGSWPQFAGRLAKKLEIETYSLDTGARLVDIRDSVGGDLETFLRLCREEHAWIIVEAIALRDERREDVYAG